MKKLILLLSFLVSLMVFGQENNQSKHHLGGHIGSVSGMGFSYRYWPTKLGGQLTFIPIFKNGGDYYMSSGISALYTLKESQFVDLYSYLGFHLTNNKYTYTEQYPTPITTVNKYNTYNTGLGIGLKFKLFKNNMDFSLQGGYGFYNIKKDTYTNKTSFQTYLAAGIGLYYHL